MTNNNNNKKVILAFSCKDSPKSLKNKVPSKVAKKFFLKRVKS